jgi:hypothetical protein
MDPIRVEFVDGRLWKVIEEYRWRFVIVPAGFLTDFASTPRALWWWLPPTGRYAPAAVVHDYLYVVGVTTREVADRLFLEGMAELGVNAVRRRLMYWAVRLFGADQWERYRLRDRATLLADRRLPYWAIRQAREGYRKELLQ